MRDRRLVTILGAGTVAVVAILVIVLLGLTPIPEFSELAGSGETGYVAYTRDRDGSIRIVDLATRESVEVTVGEDGEVAGWDDDGNLMVVHCCPTTRVQHVDPATGAQMGTTEDAGQYSGPEGRADVWISHTSGRVVLERLDGKSASFAAPESYRVESASSMGEDRIVFVDALGRVAVCHVGQDVTPIQVADDALPGPWVTGMSSRE